MNIFNNNGINNGIQANVINAVKPPRHIDEAAIRFFKAAMSERNVTNNTEITINVIMSDPEALTFARELAAMLKQEGFNTSGDVAAHVLSIETRPGIEFILGEMPEKLTVVVHQQPR